MFSRSFVRSAACQNGSRIRTCNSGVTAPANALFFNLFISSICEICSGGRVQLLSEKGSFQSVLVRIKRPVWIMAPRSMELKKAEAGEDWFWTLQTWLTGLDLAYTASQLSHTRRNTASFLSKPLPVTTSSNLLYHKDARICPIDKPCSLILLWPWGYSIWISSSPWAVFTPSSSIRTRIVLSLTQSANTKVLS